MESRLSHSDRLAERVVLDNRLRIVTERCCLGQSMAVGVFLEVGARDDPPGKAGLAHLVEHLLIRAGDEELTRLDALGGWIEAATEREYLIFHVRILEEHYRECFQILSRLLRPRRWPVRLIEQELEIISGEMALLRGMHVDACRETFLEESLGDHPLGRPIIGTASSLDSLASDDVMEFLSSCVRPERAIVSVVSPNLTSARIAAVVEESFGSSVWPMGAGCVEACGQVVPAAERFETTTEVAGLSPSVFGCFGVRAVRRDHPDRVALFGLSALLGSGLNSRLTRRVRMDRGLSYDLSTVVLLFREVGFLLLAGSWLEQNHEAVTSVVREEIERSARDPATDSEIEVVKQSLRSNLLFNLESVELRMVRLAKLESWFGRPFAVSEELAMIDELAPPSIASMATEILEPGLSFHIAMESRVGHEGPRTHGLDTVGHA